MLLNTISGRVGSVITPDYVRLRHTLHRHQWEHFYTGWFERYLYGECRHTIWCYVLFGTTPASFTSFPMLLSITVSRSSMELEDASHTHDVV